MGASVLPELAAESIETAERLVRLSGQKPLDGAEAEYILAAGVAAIQRVPRLWPIIRGRIGAGMSGADARDLLTRLIDAVDRNLQLAGVLKEPARVIGETTTREPQAVARLAETEKQLQNIRAEAVRLLRGIETPPRWPSEHQLREAKEQMQAGKRLSSEEFRQALLDE